jgi:RNA polymerase sigma-70 factor (ECF subfamily)
MLPQRSAKAAPLTDPAADDPVAPLLARIAQGERAAFRSLYALVAPKLLGVLVRMLGNRAEAEDALQEVFTRVWTRAGRYDPALGRGLSWLIAITRNLAIDRLRARPSDGVLGVEDDEAGGVADDRPGAESQLIALGEARRVVDCMGQLEPDRAAAVRGAYLQGQSYQQLADTHAVPLNTMRTWLRRSLLRLKECIES